MLKSSALKLTLILSGMHALAGCQSLPVTINSPVICPPQIPALPPVDAAGMVSLDRNDRAGLLIYFKQVEHCFSAQSVGL